MRDVSFHVARGESFGLVGESGCGKSTIALAIVRYLARNGRVSDGTIEIDGRDVLSLNRSELRRLRAETVSMVYQEPGRALNPSILVGRQVAEVYEIAGSAPGRGDGAGARDPAQGADLRPQGRDGALSAPALGRHAPARGHRHGAGLRAVAADPRRADDRAGRDRRGRGAGPDPRAALGVQHLAAVHQPQPGGDRPDVRPRRRPLRRRAGRGGAGEGGLHRSPPSLHGGAAALDPRREASTRAIPPDAGHDPGIAPGARLGDRGVHLRRSLRPRRRPLPRRRAADVRDRRRPRRSLPLPRARAERADGRDRRGAARRQPARPLTPRRPSR